MNFSAKWAVFFALVIWKLVHGISFEGSQFMTSPGWCVVFSGESSYFQLTSLQQGLQMSTCKLTQKPSEMRGVDLQWTIIPSRGVDRHTTYHFVLQTSGINLSSHRLLYLHHLFLSLYSVSIFSKMEVMISIELKEACMRCKVRALLRAFAVTYVRSSIRLFKSVIYH